MSQPAEGTDGGTAPSTRPTYEELVEQLAQFKHQQQRAEELLRRYELLVGQGRDIVLFLRHEDGRIVEANAAAQNAYGYRREEMLSLSIRDLRAPDTMSLATEQMATADACGILFETVHRRKDGSTFAVEVSSHGETINGTRTLISVVRDITERKRVEKQIERRNQQVTEILASIQDDFYVLDREWRFLHASRSFTAKIGKEPKDFLGQRIWEMFPMHLGTEYEGHCRAAMERGETRRFEMRGRYTDAWYRMTAFPSPDGITLLGTDITEQKRGEEALRDREALLHAIIETLADPLYVKDTESRLTLVNAAAVAVVGKPVEQIVGHTDREFYDDPAVGEAILAHDRRVIQSGNVHVFEEMIQTPMGYRLMLNTKAPRRDAAGRIVGLVGIARDITDSKRAEEALRDSEARFRTLFETMSEGFCLEEILCDDAGRPSDLRYLAVNPAFERYTGLKACEIVGRTTRELFPEAEDVWFEQYGRVALTGEPAHFEAQFGPLGRWFEVSAYRTEPGRFAVVFFETTDRKRAEEALRRANRDLAEANERKTEFLAMLSHELRNPLAPVRNSLFILTRAVPGSAQATRAHEVIDRQVAHMARLVDDLLDVVRIDRGKINVQKERLELGDLVRRTADDHRGTFTSGGVELEVAVGPGDLLLHADPVRMAQVVGNLLHNAAKFTPHGGLVKVGIAREGGAAVLRVRDSGIGIEAEMLERVFEPFVQADRSLDRSRGGLGLGLALVKALVVLHGGTVEAASEGRSRGATFTVRLPLEPAPASVAKDAATAPRAHVRRVLVIEDNVDAAESLRDVLELDGHEVAVAHTGPAGIARARELKPEVVLCDIGLPGMDGFAVARAFRDDPALRGAFLVALSGYSLPEDIAKAREDGFDRHLAKPASPESVAGVLAEVSARKPGAGAGRLPSARLEAKRT